MDLSSIEEPFCYGFISCTEGIIHIGGISQNLKETSSKVWLLRLWLSAAVVVRSSELVGAKGNLEGRGTRVQLAERERAIKSKRVASRQRCKTDEFQMNIPVHAFPILISSVGQPGAAVCRED